MKEVYRKADCVIYQNGKVYVIKKRGKTIGAGYDKQSIWDFCKSITGG